MKLIICYDITEDKIRNKIIDILIENGLMRIQNSVFLGDINKNKLKDIVEEIKTIIDFTTDNVCIFQICEIDYNKCDFLGTPYKSSFLEKYVII